MTRPAMALGGRVVAVLGLALVTLTGCGTSASSTDSSQVYDKPDVEVDPVKACGMLVAAPSSLAQQKAAELGCVEVGDGRWEYQGPVAAPAPPAPATPADPPATDPYPEGGMGWDVARQYAGTVQRVCGPLMSVRETADGTFVNVGRDYPSADRFTFIFWDTYLQPIPSDAMVCGTGEIYLYEGVVAQIEMWDPAALEIWR